MHSCFRAFPLKLEAGGDMSQDNAKHIRDNKAKLHELESVVLGNKQKLYAERAYIEEKHRGPLCDTYWQKRSVSLICLQGKNALMCI